MRVSEEWREGDVMVFEVDGAWSEWMGGVCERERAWRGGVCA